MMEQRVKMKIKVTSLSLKYKIAFSSLIVVLIPLLVFATLMTKMYNDAIVKRSMTYMEENVNVMSDRIEKLFSNAETCSNYLTLNINRVMSDEKNPLTIEGNILSELHSAAIIFDDLQSIQFIEI